MASARAWRAPAAATCSAAAARRAESASPPDRMLPAGERLRANRQFREVYDRGRSHANELLVLHVLRVEDARLAGFAAGKKIGKAVLRNRAKRRMREAYRRLLPRLPRGYWAIFTARKGVVSASFENLETSMSRALERAGLLRDPDVV